MPDLLADGRTRVWWVTTIANAASPTLAELDAGTVLDTILTADGLVGFEPDTEVVDTARLSDQDMTQRPGRAYLTSPALRLKKQAQAGDAVYNLLAYRTRGHVVVRRGLPSTDAWANTQAVEVYPVACGHRRNLAPEANSMHRYEVPLFLRRDAEIRAVIAGAAPGAPINEQVSDTWAGVETATVTWVITDPETGDSGNTTPPELGFFSDWTATAVQP